MTTDNGPRTNRGQFQKGRSGNPGGRPKGVLTQSSSAFAVIIGKTLTVSQGGVPRDVSIEEALQHRTYQEALSGKRMAIREVLRWIVRRERWLASHRPPVRPRVTHLGTSQDPSNADHALLLLDIARENPGRRDVRAERLQLLLEPWAVKAALSRRRGIASLKQEDIADIRRSTRDDGTVKFPKGVES